MFASTKRPPSLPVYSEEYQLISAHMEVTYRSIQTLKTHHSKHQSFTDPIHISHEHSNVGLNSLFVGGSISSLLDAVVHSLLCWLTNKNTSLSLVFFDNAISLGLDPRATNSRLLLLHDV